MVKSTTLYTSEVWEITARNQKRLKNVELNYLRRYYQLLRKDRVTNEEVKRKMEVDKHTNIIEESNLSGTDMS